MRHQSPQSQVLHFKDTIYFIGLTRVISAARRRKTAKKKKFFVLFCKKQTNLKFYLCKNPVVTGESL